MTIRRVVLFYKRLLGAGGAERQLVEEYRYLAERGVAVTAVSYEARDAALFDVDLPHLVVLPGRRAPGLMWRLFEFLRTTAPDLVSVHSGLVDVYLATRPLGIPYVYHHNSPVLLHSGSEPDTAYSWRDRRAFQRIREASPWTKAAIRSRRRFGLWGRLGLEGRAAFHRRALRAARRVVVLSDRTAWELRELYGIEPICIRGAVGAGPRDAARGATGRARLGLNGDPIVLSVSRLSAEKRLDVLLAAFDRLAGEIPGAALVMAGAGPEEAGLKRLAARLPHGGRVRFTGFVPERQLGDLYAACDLFATPAWADFDIAPYEALAWGRRVVWSTEMETEDWVRASGLVFEAEPTVEAFHCAMRRALRSHGEGRLDLRTDSWTAKYDRLYGVLA